MNFRNRLHRVMISSIVVCILAAACLPASPVQAWSPQFTDAAAEGLVSPLPLASAETLIAVSETAAERLGLEPVEPVQSLSAATQHRIETTMTSVLPCWRRYVDNVYVLRHPELGRQPNADVRDHFLAATVAVDTHDPISGALTAEPALNLTLYLPDDLLDGSGLDTPLTNTNIVPYAAAPVPQTLGDFLDWTLFHESWHLLDLDARLARHSEDLLQHEIDDVIADSEQWQLAFPELVVGQHLGWADAGEQYLLSDELEGTRSIRSGATSYQYDFGALAVDYDDGEYTFARGFQRSGHLPDELYQLADLANLLHSGEIPTLYSLFNISDERFAEYGAWFLFARHTGNEQAFQELFPELYHSFDLRLQDARDDCGSTRLDLLRVTHQ